MHLFIVVSYMPELGQYAHVLIDGIYNTQEEAVERQLCICDGDLVSTRLGNNSMYGANGRITWIKKILIGDLQKLDIHSPDPL